MAVVKVIEILSESDKSWEDATQEAVRVASKTVKNIQNVYIQDQQAIVKDGKIDKYRVNTKISFIVSD